MSQAISGKSFSNFFDMLEGLNFKKSGSTESTWNYGDASSDLFSGSSLFGSPKSRFESNQKSQSHNDILGTVGKGLMGLLGNAGAGKPGSSHNAYNKRVGSGQTGLGGLLSNDLVSKFTKDPGGMLSDAAGKFSKDPGGTLSDVAKGLGINEQIGVAGSVQGKAFETDLNYSTKGDWGSLDIKNKISFLDAKASGAASVGIKDGNVVANAEGQVSLDLMRVQTHVKSHINGVGDFDVQGDARIGVAAQGKAGVKIGKDGVYAEIGGRAFAGAEARAHGTWVSEAGTKLSAGVSAKVGIGIEAGAKIGYKDGKLDFKFNFGFAFGIGASFNIDFSIDFNKMGKAISNFFGDMGKSVGKAFGGFADGVKKIGGGIAKAVGTVGKAVGKVATAVVDTVKNIGKGIKNAFKGIGDFFKGLF